MAATALDRRPRRPAVSRSAPGVDDDRLVQRLRDGDDAAFEAIYDRYAAGLLAFCHHMLANRDDAEDALQHSLSAAYRVLRAGQEDVELRPWLYTVARNRCLSLLRARRNDIGLDAAPAPSGIADEIVDQVQRRSDLRDLMEDLRLLPDDQRAALVLFELGGVPQDEIAIVLQVRREKVKALVFQAREGLMRARRARDTPCTDMRRQLATLTGGIPSRSVLRRHVDRCPSCALFEAEVGRQRAGLALILPVLPTVGLKATVLASAVSRWTAVAGGGAGAGGSTAVLGSAAGGGGAACAGAGSGAVGLAGAGAAGGGSVAAGAAGAGVSGALASAGGAGTMAAALGAKSATVVVAKLLTVVAVAVGGGAAATGELTRSTPDAGSVPAIQQSASSAAAPSPIVEQLLAPVTPVPTVTAPTLAAGGAAPIAAPIAAHDASSQPINPAAGSQPTPAPAAGTPTAPDGGLPSTAHTDPSSAPAPTPTPTPTPTENGVPATTPPQTAADTPTTTSTAAPTGGVTTTGSGPVSDVPAPAQTTAGPAPDGPAAGEAAPTTADAGDPAVGVGAPANGETGSSGTGDPAFVGSPPPTSAGAPADLTPPAGVAAPHGTP
jgi:RNA polymerase sigma factor (sigma-70 family)